MDYAVLARIEQQKLSKEKRKAEFYLQINEAHELWSRAAAELKIANKTFLESKCRDSRAYAILANARAAEKATLRNLHQLHHERKIRFGI